MKCTSRQCCAGHRWMLVVALFVVLGRTLPADVIELAPEKPPETIRVATYNASLNRPEAGKLTDDLQSMDSQAEALASVIRAVRPDILLLNELDYSADTDHAELFHDLYLLKPEPDLLGNPPHSMPYRFSAPVNTGEPSGLDLNRSGRTTDPEDAWGYGRFPGQYGMAVLSRLPIDTQRTRTFQHLLWSELPGALQPTFPDSGATFYPPEIWRQLRLPSKSFWDVPIELESGVVHFLASHPTPPVFDGPEDRNGCRNHDEIRLLTAYIDGQPLPPRGGSRTEYFVDDQGRSGGLDEGALFVVAGDLNSDPADGDSRREALLELLHHPRVQSEPIPSSRGGVEASQQQGGRNREHVGDPAHDTGDFNDFAVGNLRVDYVLPSVGFEVLGCGVVWPVLDGLEPERAELLQRLLDASDHHLVWVDLMLPVPTIPE